MHRTHHRWWLGGIVLLLTTVVGTSETWGQASCQPPGCVEKEEIDIRVTPIRQDVDGTLQDCFQIYWELHEDSTYRWYQLLRLPAHEPGEAPVGFSRQNINHSGHFNNERAASNFTVPAVIDCPPPVVVTVTYRVEVLSDDIVRLFDNQGPQRQIWWNSKMVTRPSAPTAVPAGLDYVQPAESNDRVGELSWRNLTAVERGNSPLLRWEVQYRFDAGPWLPADPPPDSLISRYTDTTIWKREGTQLWFRVRPFTEYMTVLSGIEAAHWSAPYRAWDRTDRTTPAPDVGTTLTLVPSTAQLNADRSGWYANFEQPHLSWGAAPGTVLGYQVLWRPAPTAPSADPLFTAIHSVLENVTEYTLSSPLAGEDGQVRPGVYELRVQAFDGKGGGPASNTVRLTVVDTPAPIEAPVAPPPSTLAVTAETSDSTPLCHSARYRFTGPNVLLAGAPHTFKFTTFELNQNFEITHYSNQGDGHLRGLGFDVGEGHTARWVTTDDPAACEGVTLCGIRPPGNAYVFHPPAGAADRWLAYRWRSNNGGIPVGATVPVRVPRALRHAHPIRFGFVNMTDVENLRWEDIGCPRQAAGSSVDATLQPVLPTSPELQDRHNVDFTLHGPTALAAGRVHTLTLAAATATAVRYGGRHRSIAFRADSGGLGHWVAADNPAACQDVEFCALRPAGAGYGFYPADDRPSRWLAYWRGSDVTDGLTPGAEIQLYVPATLTTPRTAAVGFARVPLAGDPVWLTNSSDPPAVTHRVLWLDPARATLTDFAHRVLADNSIRIRWAVTTSPAVRGLRLQFRPADQPDAAFVRAAPDLAVDLGSYLATPMVPDMGTRTYEYRLGTYGADDVAHWFAPRVRATVPGPTAGAVSAQPRFALTPAERAKYTFDAMDPELLLFTFTPGTRVEEQPMPRATGGRGAVVHRANDLAAVGLQFVPATHELQGTARRGAIYGTLRAVDAAGAADILRFRIVVGDPPLAPGGLTANPVAGRTDRVALTWTAPTDAFAAGVLGYRIAQAPDVNDAPGNWAVVVGDTRSLVTEFVHAGVAAAQKVHYRVAAVSAVGVSEYSHAVAVTTPDAEPPGPPTAVHVESAHRRLTVRWAPPAHDGGAPITHYRVEYSDNNTDFTPLPELAATARAYVRDQPIGGRVGYFRVTARTRHGLGTPAAVVAGISTVPPPPGAPTDLAVDPVDRVQRLRLTWAAPAETHGLPIVGYRVQRRTTGSSAWTTVVENTRSVSREYVDAGPVTGCPSGSPPGGLCAGMEYVYQVAAFTAAGVGTYSMSSPEATTVAAGIPGPPAAVRVGRPEQSGTKLQVDWIAPVHENGATVHDYTVQWRPDGGTWSDESIDSANTLTATLTGLTASTTYEVRVATVPQATEPPNAADPGRQSPWSASVPATTFPVNAATETLAPLHHFENKPEPDHFVYQWRLWFRPNQVFNTVWLAVTPQDGGPTCEAAFPTLQVQEAYGNDGLGSHRIDLARTHGAYHLPQEPGDNRPPCLVAGDIILRIRTAFNDRISPDQFRNVTYPSAPPAPPRNLRAVPRVGGVDLHWATPHHFGNAAFTEYRIEWCAPTAACGHTVRLGSGGQDGMVEWLDPDGDVVAGPSGWELHATVASGVRRLAVDATDRPRGTWLRVRARNANAADAWSDAEAPNPPDCQPTGRCTANTSVPSNVVKMVAASAPLQPDPPRALRAAVSVTPPRVTVQLHWQAPVAHGHSVNGYRIERASDLTAGPEHADGWTTLADDLAAGTTTYVDDNPPLAPGRSLHYRITTRGPSGGGGDSLPSNAVAARLPMAVPVAPAAVMAFPGREDTRLEWATPPVPGDTPVTDYRVEYSVDGRGGWQPIIAATAGDIGGASTRYLDSSPPVGTPRYYRVAAWNASGLGAWSATFSGTVDAGRPGPPQNLRLRIQGAAVELRWDAPAAAGGPGATLSGYRVDRSTDGGDEWIVVSNSTESVATVYVDTSAPAEAEVTYRVFARNGTADTHLSLPAGYATITVVRSWPPWPQNFVVTPRVQRHELTWRAVQPGGGRSVTGYRLEWARVHARAHPLWEGDVTLDGAATTHYVRHLPATLEDGTHLHYRIVTLTAARESEYSAPVTAPVYTAVGQLDFNRDRRFNRADALILYYAYAFADEVGDGTPTGGLANLRRELLMPLASTSDDAEWRHWLTAAHAVQHGGLGLNFNGDGTTDVVDAQLLLYRLDPAFDSALADAPGRQVLLHPLVPEVMRTDAALLELLETIDRLSGH